MTLNAIEFVEIPAGNKYFQRTHRPLQCLIFIAPLLIIYQIGLGAGHSLIGNQAGPAHVLAFVFLLKFFRLFGVAGNFLPLLMTVGLLLAWHVARKDKWEIDLRLYGCMAIESFLLAIPIVLIGIFLSQHRLYLPGSPLGASPGADLAWRREAMLAIGAGLYEELLFRLIAITVLKIILVDVLELGVHLALPLIILTTAVLFAAYHYMGHEHFEPYSFAFRTVSGIYLAGIFLGRGFGIAVGTHAIFDLILVAGRHL